MTSRRYGLLPSRRACVRASSSHSDGLMSTSKEDLFESWPASSVSSVRNLSSLSPNRDGHDGKSSSQLGRLTLCAAIALVPPPSASSLLGLMVDLFRSPRPGSAGRLSSCEQKCQPCPSTARGTQPRRCYSAEAFIRRSSARCSATRRSRSRSTSTRTSRRRCTVRLRESWMRSLAREHERHRLSEPGVVLPTRVEMSRGREFDSSSGGRIFCDPSRSTCSRETS
jgi:hypothetical protein